MARLFKKTLRPVGLPPGSLLYPSHVETHNVRISVIEYTEEKITERDWVSIAECLELLDTPAMTWIQVYGVSNPQMVATIGKHFKFHPLALEDILVTGQHSKLDIYQDQVFIVARLLKYDDKAKDLKDEQVSLMFGSNYLVCFLEREEDVFQPVKERLRQNNNRMRKGGSDYLAYAILDTIVDYYYVVLEKVDINLEHLEEEVLSILKSETVQKIQRTKRDLIIMRKAVWPMREVINRFIRLESPLISSTTQLYLHDVYDHTVQMMDIIEGFRDVASGMLDIYLSNINIRTNEVMKVLTVVSTIFVPLTFITSVYGMNFEFMPELHYPWAYPIVLCVMAIMAGGMLIIFRLKNWL